MPGPLSGRVALVTSGVRGIGAATARRLADEGADVAVSYVGSGGKADALVGELSGKGVRAAAFKADQADARQVNGLVEAVVAHFGRLDILVNNAELFTTGFEEETDIKTPSFGRQQAVSVIGAIAAIRSAMKVMGDGGRIITVGSSIAGITQAPRLADYAGTKAAIAGYSKGAARDLGPRNITVNVVQPGVIDTGMGSGVGESAPCPWSTATLQRHGRPEDIAAGIAFLASPEASYVTGTILNIGGHGA